jgi:phosphate transport system protein
MSTRATYEYQIQELSGMVVTMASMVDKAIARAIEALRLQNVALAKDVRAGDAAINEMHRRGEEMTIILLATQGPVGSDLRRIASSMALFSNLERMGDYATGIAKIVVESANEEPIKPLVDIPRMAHIAREMLDEAITAYIEMDADKARQISVRDDELDDLYDAIFQELMTYMARDPNTVPGATRLLWVAHNLERIGDRVTNVCERVVYIATGEFEELDGGRFERQKLPRNGSSDSGVSGNA